MPVINRQSTTTNIVSGSGTNFVPLSLSGVVFSAGNWAADTPTNLEAIADPDPSTATTWGRTHGGGNKGWIQADLGQALNRLYLELKLGIRMNTGWPNGEATWTVEASPNTDFFAPLWQAIRIRPSATEQILQLNLWGGFLRYLRVTTEDVGSGQAELRLHDFKVWQVNL